MSPDSVPLIFTAILRTSKAVHQEAEPILYEKNRFEATMKLVHSPSG